MSDSSGESEDYDVSDVESVDSDDREEEEIVSNILTFFNLPSVVYSRYQQHVYNFSYTPNEKDIKSIVDYEKITNKLENLTKSKKYNFLESLAEDSFKEIFEDKRINSIKIKIEKPEAIKNAGSVGVEVFKTRKDYEGS